MCIKQHKYPRCVTKADTSEENVTLATVAWSFIIIWTWVWICKWSLTIPQHVSILYDGIARYRHKIDFVRGLVGYRRHLSMFYCAAILGLTVRSLNKKLSNLSLLTNKYLCPECFWCARVCRMEFKNPACYDFISWQLVVFHRNTMLMS